MVACIKRKLEADDILQEKTNMSTAEISTLLNFCLNCTYFVFNWQYYRQIRRVAMWSPVSMIVCNAQMEELEELTIATEPNPLHWWYRYVDDTDTKVDAGEGQAFDDHLNSLDLDIQFTTEGEEDGALAFLDTKTVRKPRQLSENHHLPKSDPHLNFSSNHPLEHKLSVVRILDH